MAAVARCFPGKAKGGGDRKPDAEEIARCRTFLEREVEILQPELVIAVGTLAITEVLGDRADGQEARRARRRRRPRVRGTASSSTSIALPHPSGASPWHKIEPGKTLLRKALGLIERHPATRASLLG